MTIDEEATANILSLSITGQAASVSVNFATGDPLPIGGLYTDAASVELDGSHASDPLVTTSTAALIGSDEIRYPATTTLTDNLTSNGGIIAINGTTNLDNLTGEALTVAPGATVYVNGSQTFSSLEIAAGGTVRMAQNGIAVLTTSVLTIDSADSSGNGGGVLDLADNDLIVHGGDLSNLSYDLTNGYDAGKWDGEVTDPTKPCILSSTAAADSSQVEALGYVQIGTSASTGQLNLSSFDGVSVVPGDVVVAFTTYGDANLDGVVDAADQNLTEGGYTADQFNSGALAGWSKGDFNYDGTVNGSDIALFDRLYVAAPTALTAASPGPNEVDLAWTASTNNPDDPVNILNSTDGINFSLDTTADAGQSSLQAIGLAPGTEYWFEITTADPALGDSAPSNIAEVTTPADPWNLHATGSTTVAEGGIYSLTLLASPTGSAPAIDHWTVDWDDGTVSTYTPAQVAAGPLTHIFAAGADQALLGITASTSSLVAVPFSVIAPIPAIDVIPTAPTNVVAQVNSDSDVTVTWQSSSQATDEYAILRSDNGSAFETIGNANAGDTSYDDSTVTATDEVEYEVQAVGAIADVMSTSTASTAVEAPANPLTFSAAPGSDGSNSVLLTWAYAYNDDSGFEIEMEDQTAGTNFQQILSGTSVNSTQPVSTTYTGLTGGHTYLFRIRADHNDGSVSQYVQSDPVTVPIADAPDLSLTTITVGIGASAQQELRVGWSGALTGAGVEIDVQSAALPGNNWVKV